MPEAKRNGRNALTLRPLSDSKLCVRNAEVGSSSLLPSTIPPPRQPLRLKRAPKYGRSGNHRVVPPRETCRRARLVMKAIGVTRLSDVTGLDYVGIPVWAAVRPIADSSSISVQNGKGLTRMYARAGAMMEAIEHYCCERLPHTPHCADYRRLRRQARAVDPQSLLLDPQAGYTDTLPLEWLRGTDLRSAEQVWVPSCAVLKPRRGDRTPRVYRGSTNGLASGNTIEEAVCHGLAEAIERDAWTLAIVRGMLLPRIRAIAGAVAAGAACDVSAIHDVVPDGRLFPIIDLTTLAEPARALAAKFAAAGVRVVVRDITTDLGIPTFVAAGWETPAGRIHFHSGLGTHPDARVAATRALTELAQSRLTIFQGVREDIDKVAQRDGVVDRPSQSLWLSDGPLKSFDAVHSYRNDDILEDIQIMSDRVHAAGLEQVIAVDLTRPEVGLPVVKVLVPGLEHWAARHFDPDVIALGARATRCLV
jgi:ribosomal protein S12 methylthiotransferase accessory factor